MGRVRLVVQADDLGMCRAVNEGIEHAIVDGIVTQTSVMAPTPWFEEGAAMALRTGVTTGLHATFTCEWDYLRWAPLSTGASLRLDDGTMPRTVEEAAARIDVDDGVAELRVQAARATAAGLRLSYVDPHMGVSVASAYGAMCEELGVRFMYPGIDPHHSFDSIYVLSMAAATDLDSRTSRFVDWLDRAGDGVHFVLTHPGVASEELRAICSPDHPDIVWAETWRVADLAALTDPAVRAVIERRGIELVTVADL
ncbi:MAG: ChbG/HpnK family deacetylase [Ilumatobacteraceae bacterium]